MAKLIVHNPPTVKLKASGYTGTPTGDIELTENNKTYNVSPFATATTAIPEEEKTVTPSTVEQVITPDEGLLKKVTVNPTPLVEKTVTPTTEQQTIVPQSPAIGFSQVKVNPVTAEIDSDIQPENIKQGIDILGVQGTLKPPVLIEKTITENGTYAAADDNADGYSDVVVEVGGTIEEKAVNFYDYDGTVLYAYTAQEALALAELPEAPTHEGLTFQGWNRTLAQLQAYVTDYGIGDAGATYITDDGSTRLFLEVGQDVSLDFTLYCQIANGTLSVEVDGVELGSATGTSYGNYTIPFTLPNRGNIRVDLKFTGTGRFYIGQRDLRTRVFGWNSDQNGCLVKVELGEHITSINASAFNGCVSLTNIVVPNSVTGIGAYAFYNCASLNSIVIPSSVTSIIVFTFNNCTSLTNIVVPNSVTVIDNYAFYNCTSLNSIVIPSSVTSIGIYAFSSCSSLNSVVIPSSVTSISNRAFSSCISLNSVVIPSSVTSIGADAFYGCSSLNSIVIPSSVTSIGAGAFIGCELLLFFDLSQYTDPNNLPTFSNSSFLSNTPTDQIIYVANQEMLTAFSSATNISVYANRMVIKGATS